MCWVDSVCRSNPVGTSGRVRRLDGSLQTIPAPIRTVKRSDPESSPLLHLTSTLRSRHPGKYPIESTDTATSLRRLLRDPSTRRLRRSNNLFTTTVLYLPSRLSPGSIWSGDLLPSLLMYENSGRTHDPWHDSHKVHTNVHWQCH